MILQFRTGHPRPAALGPRRGMPLPHAADHAPPTDPRNPWNLVRQQRTKPLELLFTQQNSLKSMLPLSLSLNHIRAARR